MSFRDIVQAGGGDVREVLAMTNQYPDTLNFSSQVWTCCLKNASEDHCIKSCSYPHWPLEGIRVPSQEPVVRQVELTIGTGYGGIWTATRGMTGPWRDTFR